MEGDKFLVHLRDYGASPVEPSVCNYVRKEQTVRIGSGVSFWTGGDGFTGHVTLNEGLHAASQVVLLCDLPPYFFYFYTI
jgi:hypothetical protein